MRGRVDPSTGRMSSRNKNFVLTETSTPEHLCITAVTDTLDDSLFPTTIEFISAPEEIPTVVPLESPRRNSKKKK